MAPPAGTLRVGRYFLSLLAIMVVLYAIVFWPGQRHTPKLGIDLAGGQQITFTATTANHTTPKRSAMQEAKQIMTARVNGTGVTQATVVIQGSNQLVVSVPGSTTQDIKQLGQAAQLNFRGVVMPATTVSCTSASASASASASPSATTSTGSTTSTASTTPATSSSTSAASAKGAADRPLTAASASSTASSASSTASSASASSTSASTSSSASATPSSTASSSAAATPCTATPFKGLKFTVPTNETAYDTLTSTQQTQLQTALASYDCNSTKNEADVATTYYLACDDPKTNGIGTAEAYLLSPVVVKGSQIDTASAVAPNVAGGGSAEWTVSLTLKGSGQAAWAKYTSAHNIGSTTTSTSAVSSCGSAQGGSPCADYVAFTLDGVVISAPVNEEAINGGATQISGSFTQSSATDLATQLKYGALPLTFSAQNAEQVSPTLGSSQLKAGLLAGGIGLALVIIYSFIYYRALGLVTITSLMVSGALTYACLVILGTQIDFTLSLAGIAGFIVAVGITADSFVVFFERIKDEVHEGRTMRVAVPRAWVRARRTILSADTVSFLAAATLYYFTSSDVKGFAFTLGLSTILDLVVVFLFTHPLISRLSRSRAFGSARFTGLNSVREGGIASYEPDATPPPGPRPARGAAAAEEPVADRFSGVAVLDRRDKPGRAGEPAPEEFVDDELQPDDEPEPDDEPDFDGEDDEPDGELSAAVTEGAPAEDAAGDDESEVAQEPAPRAKPTPEPGSAAERAAARRARLRAERDEKGNR